MAASSASRTARGGRRSHLLAARRSPSPGTLREIPPPGTCLSPHRIEVGGRAPALDAQQQRAHPPFPELALLGDEQELTGGQTDALGLGPDQARTSLEVGVAESVLDAVGKALRPAMVGSTSKHHQ